MMQRKKRFFIVLVIVILGIAVGLSILRHISATYLKREIESALGENVKADSVRIGWESLAVENLAFTRGGQQVGSIKEIAVRPEILSFLHRRIALSRIAVNEPCVKIEVTKGGKVLLPVALPVEKKKPETGKDVTPVTVNQLIIQDGAIDFEDQRPTKPVHIRMERLVFNADDLAHPVRDRWTSYQLTGQVAQPGKNGEIQVKGKTNFGLQETKVEMSLKRIDLVQLRPYIENPGDPEISRGNIDMTMNIHILKRRIRAPGKLSLRNLEFKPGSGVKDTFLGVPRALVIKLLKSEGNEIKLDFMLEGDLDNPRFSIRENLARRLTASLAGQLGLTVVDVGETLVVGGAKVIDKTADTVKGLFKRR